MDITVQITGQCTSGGHINFKVTTPKGIKDITLNKSDFQIEPDEWETTLVIVLRNFVKESGLTNWTQIKTAIEGKVFKI